MKGKIIKDWSKVNLRNPEHQKKLIGAFNHFFSQPQENPVLRTALQHFTTKGDFPAEVLAVLQKFNQTPDFDLGYESIFDIRDFTSTNASGFDILDVTSGLTFAKVLPGEKAKVYKMSGAKASVSFDQYGGALHWLRTWFDDNQYWNVEDTAIQFRNQAFYSRASDFYALIEALPNDAAHNVDWATTSVATADKEYQTVRDALTIEAACLEILTAIQNKGYGINPNSQFFVLAPVDIRGRIIRALSRVNQPVAGSPKDVQYNVSPIFTMMLATKTKYYVIFPKAKLKGGYRMNLTMFADFDILAYADLVAGWQRYGGAIGDTDQLRRCSIS